MQSELKLLKKKKNKEAPVMNGYYFKTLKKLSFTKIFFSPLYNKFHRTSVQMI